jgi:hypothetical protein
MALSMIGVASCGLVLTSHCDGHCRYTLTAVFKTGIQRQAAESVLATCVRNPIVIRVGAFTTMRYPLGGVPPGQDGSHLVATEVDTARR